MVLLSSYSSVSRGYVAQRMCLLFPRHAFHSKVVASKSKQDLAAEKEEGLHQAIKVPVHAVLDVLFV